MRTFARGVRKAGPTLVFALLCSVVPNLHSQDFDRAEVFGGYSYLGLVSGGFTSVPLGFQTDVNINVNRWFGAEGALNYNHGSGVGILTALGGPRFTVRGQSERRTEAVKEYLISQGIAADKIEIRAEGKDKQLDQKKVEELQSADNQKPPAWMNAKEKATWLAYNRRVDIILEPVGQESTEAYPNDANDARILWQLPAPKLNAVESAERIPSTGESPAVSATNR